MNEGVCTFSGIVVSSGADIKEGVSAARRLQGRRRSLLHFLSNGMRMGMFTNDDCSFSGKPYEYSSSDTLWTSVRQKAEAAVDAIVDADTMSYDG